MADFETILKAISLATQAAQATEPALESFSADHQAATSQLLQVAGATAAASVTDPQKQQEAVAATQVAVSAVPVFFKLFNDFKNLFHKKPATP